jgi:predicted SnoaL-like aldol condensation-catalyzing enzyme
LVWEAVNYKADQKTGVTNYVISYYEVTFTKGEKKAKIIFNMNFGIKDGKIVEEWDTYDTAPLKELLK